jgi:hypothetical protein
MRWFYCKRFSEATTFLEEVFELLFGEHRIDDLKMVCLSSSSWVMAG